MGGYSSTEKVFPKSGIKTEFADAMSEEAACGQDECGGKGGRLTPEVKRTEKIREGQEKTRKEKKPRLEGGVVGSEFRRKGGYGRTAQENKTGGRVNKPKKKEPRGYRS